MNDIPSAGLYVVAAAIFAVGVLLVINPRAAVRRFQAGRPSESRRGFIANIYRRYWAPENTEAIVGSFRLIGVGAIFFGIFTAIAIYAARVAGS
jgi:hypothetical protein